MMTNYLTRLILIALMLAVLPLTPASRTMAAGDCTAISCGPSGMFTRDTFPTIAGIDFAAFPRNPTRPYAGRMWYVRPDGSDQAQGTTSDTPLATINRAVQLAQSGDAIQVGDGVYHLPPDAG